MAFTATLEVRPVPVDFDTLTLATVAISTAHLVYFKNRATQREAQYAITSTDVGLLTVNRSSDSIKVIPGEWYEIRATLATATDYNENVTLTLGSATTNVLIVRFTEVYDGSAMAEFTNMTLSVD